MGLPNDVYFQIGMLTTLGLTTKNAILIVQFAKRRVEEGMELIPATLEAAKLRLRPILMTSLAFGFGVLPLGDRQRRRCRSPERHRHRRAGRRGDLDVPGHAVRPAVLRADLQDVGRLSLTRAGPDSRRPGTRRADGLVTGVGATWALPGFQPVA